MNRVFGNDYICLLITFFAWFYLAKFIKIVNNGIVIIEINVVVKRIDAANV